MIKLFQTFIVLLLFCATAVYAQPRTASAPVRARAAAPGTPAAHAAPASEVPGMTQEELNTPFSGSLFLTPLEINAIQLALRGRLTKSPELEDQMSAIPQRRVIRISGVFYRSPTDWIVWMNNEKVTPHNLLPEIVDINVKPSSKVSLDWYDRGLNQVLSITLRPHQTYDIATGILLPQ